MFVFMYKWLKKWRFGVKRVVLPSICPELVLANRGYFSQGKGSAKSTGFGTRSHLRRRRAPLMGQFRITRRRRVHGALHLLPVLLLLLVLGPELALGFREQQTRLRANGALLILHDVCPEPVLVK